MPTRTCRLPALGADALSVLQSSLFEYFSREYVHGSAEGGVSCEWLPVKYARECTKSLLTTLKSLDSRQERRHPLCGRAVLVHLPGRRTHLFLVAAHPPPHLPAFLPCPFNFELCERQLVHVGPAQPANDRSLPPDPARSFARDLGRSTPTQQVAAAPKQRYRTPRCDSRERRGFDRRCDLGRDRRSGRRGGSAGRGWRRWASGLEGQDGTGDCGNGSPSRRRLRL